VDQKSKADRSTLLSQPSLSGLSVLLPGNIAVADQIPGSIRCRVMTKQ
jgi:hypothetical protein